MSVAYTYEVIKVDQAAKAMEIVYASPGRRTMHIGARMPYAGETLDAIVQMYSPVAYWLEQEAAVEPVTQGATGAFTPPESLPMTLERAKSEKLAEIAAWRYQRETSGVVLNGARIQTDRESQATISGAYSSLRDGLITSVDWKTTSGSFVTLGLAEVTALAQAVASHVQQSFTAEKGYVQQVQAATTIEAVQAIALPSDSIPVTQL